METYAEADVKEMTRERKLRLYANLASELSDNMSFTTHIRSVEEAEWIFDEICYEGYYNDMYVPRVLPVIARALEMQCSVRVGRQYSPVVYIKPPANINDAKRIELYDELANAGYEANADEIQLEIHGRNEAWYRDGKWEPTEHALEHTASMQEKYPDRYDGEWRPSFMTDLRLWWD